MRETSLAVWQAIQDSLPRRRREVLNAVLAWPGSTATELEHRSGLRHLNKRLSELARLGLISSFAAAPCTRTGHQALRWQAELNPVAKPDPVVSWKQRALRAEAELASLRRTLALAPQEELELRRVS